MRRTRRWLGNGLLLVLSIAVAELALRPLLGGLEHVYLYEMGGDPSRCGSLRAAAHVRYTGWLRRIPPIDQEVNALGYRGVERPQDDPAAPFRIAAVGDSFTYGLGVTADDALPARLEAALHDRAAPSIQVLNFGVPGAALPDTVVRTRSFVARWHPDLVLLFLYADDLERPLCAWQEHARFAVRVARGDTTELWAQRDHVVALAAGALSMESSIVRTIAFVHALGVRWLDAVGDDDAWTPRLASQLESLRDAAAQAGSHLAVVVLGDPSTYRRTAAVADVLRSTGVPFLDARGWLFGTGDERLPIIPGDFHLTAQSNARAAETVAAWLVHDRVVGGGTT